VTDPLHDRLRRALATVPRLRLAILFGSRARGDARLDSDLDLAFEHRSSDAEWAEFVNRMRDEAPTLLSLDLLDLARVEPALRARIAREGRRVHG
jgi:predicted nucleotidyltransferase